MVTLQLQMPCPSIHPPACSDEEQPEVLDRDTLKGPVGLSPPAWRTLPSGPGWQPKVGWRPLLRRGEAGRTHG